MSSFNLITNRNFFCALLVALVEGGLGNDVHILGTGGVTAGYSTNFTCFSPCFPNCIYTWKVGDRIISGSTLAWTPDGRDDTVELQCTVRNPETGISTSTTTTVYVRNPVSVQTSPRNTVPFVNQTLNLICQNVASGDPQGPSEIIWSKDGAKLTLHEHMQLLQNNRTLHFDPMLPSDVGFYRCETYLPTRQTRVFSLGYQLSTDPWNITISGPDSVFAGRVSEFICLTSCRLFVECTVFWQVGGSFLGGDNLFFNISQFKWTPSTPGTLQNFTCIAENRTTGRFAEATIMVAVNGSPGSAVLQLSGLFPLILIVGIFTLFYVF